MQYAEIANEISSKLRLEEPPVALAFVEDPPAGVSEYGQEVPSACTFWRKAETGVFYAPAEKHFNCPIGVMTMGFEMPESIQQNLMDVVQMMTSNEYITSGEPANIPTEKKKKSGILYGPLSEFPIEPDVILMWMSPRQAMIFNEAAGVPDWTSPPDKILGRPACAALPAALDESRPRISLGCAGMRTFSEISDDRMLGVLPAGKAGDFLAKLDSTLQANSSMQAFYDQHKAKFSA